MIDVRPVLFVVGILLTTLAGFMFVPALVDLAVGNPDWRVFLAGAFFTLFIGVTLVLMNRTGPVNLTVRQTFLLTTLAWLVMAAFAALPFSFAELELDYADAFFEAMSGLTTTGSTVIVGLDYAPPGILLWRALLQWLGGIGIIVMAIAVLPMLGVGGMQLFRTESSGTSEKVLPRVAQMSTAIALIYVTLTAAAAVAYWVAGMTVFEAVCHAMTTIATAGYSTSDASLGHFGSTAIEWIATAFMVIGGIPFILYFQVVRGQGGALWRDSQVRSFVGLVVVAVLVLAGWLWLAHDAPVEAALRFSALNTISVITGTGYSSTDYGAWGGFAVTTLLFLMVVGGCTGSTTGGIKVFRFQVLYVSAAVQVRHLLQPHGVFVAHYNRKPVPDSVAEAVMSFFFLFLISFAVVAVTLATLGLDFMTSVSGAATALANVGPGLGEVIGPAGTFAPLPDAAKWVLSAAMLLGRLELFTVLVLFTARFWRG
ncbi:MAG: TrkH family potassium uptake protein [Alphaproteobacteria bacterium]